MKKLLVLLVACIATMPALAQVVQSGGRQSSGTPMRLDDQKWIKVTGTPAAMLTSAGVVSLFRGGAVIITGLTAERIKLEGIIDPSGVPVVYSVQVQALDGTISSADALNNGVYYFDVLFEDMKVTKSAGAENASVTLYFRT